MALSSCAGKIGRISTSVFMSLMRNLLHLPGLLAALLCAPLHAQANAPAAVAATASAGPVFDILEFDIGGNTVLSSKVIENTVYPHLGYDKGVADVEAARAALEKAYQDNGYLSVTVTIPEQPVTQGVIRLQVTEGSVERLIVSGNKYTSRSDIRAQVPALAAGSVPHFPEMQEQLGGLSRTPDRKVTPLLRPGRNLGKLEVELAVEDQPPFHGSVELNNKQSPSTTSTRLETSLRYDNLFQKQHSFGLNYIVAPQDPDEVNVLVTSYTAPLNEKFSLSGFLLKSNSNIASTFDSGVVGKGTVLGLRLNRALPGLGDAPTFFHSFSLGFDHKDFKETQNTLGVDSKNAPLKYTPLLAQYTFGSFSESGDMIGNLIFLANLRSSDPRMVDCAGIELEQFACRRFGAQENFSIIRGDLSWSRRLAGWEGSMRGDFQTTNQPLVSNEQFLAGGAESVRGYLEGEAAGDAGLRVRSHVQTPSLIDVDPYSLRGVAFFDAARLKLKDPLPGQTGSFWLSGTGLGLRLKAPYGMQFSLDWARALSDGPITDKGDHRVHVRLSTTF